MYCIRFFFLLGLVTYLKYFKSRSQEIARIIIVFAAYYCLPFSFPFIKACGGYFSVALFTIDFFIKRPLSLKLFTEKIPFFLLSAIAGYLTLHSQNKQELRFRTSFHSRQPNSLWLLRIHDVLRKNDSSINLKLFIFACNNFVITFEYYIGPVFLYCKLLC